MNDLECPYCNKMLENPDDCYEPSSDYQEQCSKCNKKFIFTIDYFVSYSSQQADCLNGIPHKWKEIVGYPKEYFENKRRCTMCNKEITLAKKEVTE